jgi:hypothetical protein
MMVQTSMVRAARAEPPLGARLEAQTAMASVQDWMLSTNPASTELTELLQAENLVAANSAEAIHFPLTAG